MTATHSLDHGVPAHAMAVPAHVASRSLPADPITVLWHTARIVTTSITVSINGATSGNWLQYRQDYCASVAQRSRIRAALLAPYLDVLGVLLSIFDT
jgi:hypothetical protein